MVAWKGSGYQKSRVNHKPRGTWPGFEQRRPFPQAKRVRKRGSSWVSRAESEGAELIPTHAKGHAEEGLPVCRSEWVSDRVSLKS